MTLSTSFSGLPHDSSPVIVFPQKPQDSPLLFRKGLWEAQVPLNSPSFFNINLTDISTKNSAINPIPKNTVAITQI